ncbi:MAG TPA: hypothetical protein VHK26_05435 [Methyloceanibacter sp.]|jgi:hypothetical protein|nr:hypothetical protein [Methyloceanibacter sp.]
MATTHRANVTFRAKECGAEPAIEVQQLGGDVDILPDNLYFDPPLGTSLKEAEKIASYLNETIKGISWISFEKAGGTSGDDHRGIH